MGTKTRFQLLLTVPGGDDGPAFLKLCHLPVVARVAIAAARAGASRICVQGEDDAAVARARSILEGDRRLSEVELRFSEPPDDDLPVIEAAGDIAVPIELFQRLAASRRPLTVPGAPEVRRAATDSQGEPEPLWEGEPPENMYVLRIRDRRDLSPARRTLIHHTRSFKPRGPVTRYLNEHISLPMSMVLMETPVTANQVTAVAAALVLASAYLLSVDNLWLVALGGLLLHGSSVLDCVDGELARARFAESKLGAWFDVITDHVTYPLILIGLFVGYDRFARAEGVPWAPYVGEIALGVLILTTVCVGGMFLYMHIRRLGVAMTYLVEGIRAAGRQGNVFYRVLDALTALGRRSAITLAFFLTTGLAAIGLTPAYHFLIFATVIFVLLANVYLLLGVMHARSRKPAV